MDAQQLTMPQRPVLGVSGLLIEGDSVLLIKRGYPPSVGQWAMPGGKVEWGEPGEIALAREFLEETGLRVVSAGLLASLETFNRAADGSIAYHFVINVHRCRRLDGTPQAGSDAADIALIPFADLARYEVTRTTLKALRIAGQPIDSLVAFTTRLAEPGDLPVVRDILRQAFAIQAQRLGYIPGSLGESEGTVAADIAAGTTHIGHFRSLPVATGRVRLADDGSAHVYRLGVDLEYQGLGLGRRMLWALEESARAQGATRAKLVTSEQMTGNEAFYLRCGYSVCERRQNDKQHIVLTKPLT